MREELQTEPLEKEKEGTTGKGRQILGRRVGWRTTLLASKEKHELTGIK